MLAQYLRNQLSGLALLQDRHNLLSFSSSEPPRQNILPESPLSSVYRAGAYGCFSPGTSDVIDLVGTTGRE